VVIIAAQVKLRVFAAFTGPCSSTNQLADIPVVILRLILCPPSFYNSPSLDIGEQVDRSLHPRANTLAVLNQFSLHLPCGIHALPYHALILHYWHVCVRAMACIFAELSEVQVSGYCDPARL